MNYNKCKKCGGNLLPKQDPKSKEWSLICENYNENNCFEIFLDPDYQEIFKELKKWKLDPFSIHDFIKKGKTTRKMLEGINTINNMNLKVYKYQNKAFNDFLKLPFITPVNILLIKLKYQFNYIYNLIITGIIL
jgi:ssDNA-binding Zn-finger/Zn-ribbon topoisomerase 1